VNFKKQKIFIFLSIIVFLVFLFIAQDYSHLLKYETFTLDNGLTVYLVQKNETPLISVWLSCKTGAYTETPETNGMTHLFEHMYFKANKNMKSAEEYFSTINKFGILYNGYTSVEYVYYYYILPKFYIESALKFMHDSIVLTGLNPDELEKEKEVIEEEYNLRNSDPEYYLLNKIMPQALYGDQFYRFDVIGDMSVVKSATIEQLKNIKENFFTPKNSALFIVGDFESENAKKLVTEIFNDWEGKEPPQLNIQPVKDLTSNIIKFNYMQNPYYAKIFIMMNGPGTNNKDEERLGYAADVLFGSISIENHPFEKALRPYAYDWDFYYQTSIYDGPIYFSAIVPVNQVGNVYKIFKDNFNKLVNNQSYWDNQFIETARQSYAINQINLNKTRDIEKVGSFCSRTWASNFFPKILDLYQQYNSVTSSDIKEFIQKYLLNKFWVVGVLINKTKADTYQYSKTLK